MTQELSIPIKTHNKREGGITDNDKKECEKRQ